MITKYQSMSHGFVSRKKILSCKGEGGLFCGKYNINTKMKVKQNYNSIALELCPKSTDKLLTGFLIEFLSIKSQVS